MCGQVFLLNCQVKSSCIKMTTLSIRYPLHPSTTYHVSSKNRTMSMITIPSAKHVSDKRRIPSPTPVITDMVATRVIAHIIITWFVVLISMSLFIKFRPRKWVWVSQHLTRGLRISRVLFYEYIEMIHHPLLIRFII